MLQCSKKEKFTSRGIIVESYWLNEALAASPRSRSSHRDRRFIPGSLPTAPKTSEVPQTRRWPETFRRGLLAIRKHCYTGDREAVSSGGNWWPRSHLSESGRTKLQGGHRQVRAAMAQGSTASRLKPVQQTSVDGDQHAGILMPKPSHRGAHPNY